MRIPLTLSLYIARHFFQSILMVLGGLMAVVLLLDTVELIRRASGRAVSLPTLLEMSFLKAPEMAARILPFAVMIGAMVALTKLSRSSELTAARAAGMSVWQILRPAWFTALLMGVLFVSVLNPISAAMLERFEQMEAKYISGRPSLLSISSSGLWLRDFDERRSPRIERIFHAMRLSQQETKLYQVIVFHFDEHSTFLGRMDADSVQLQNGYWLLENVILSRPGRPPEHRDTYALSTELTLEQIQDSFASPETLSFWDLPEFIKVLEAAGFSAIRHKLYLQITLASPLMLVGMVFIAAAFSLRLPRRGGIAPLVVSGIVSGFVIYFLSDLIQALGLSGSLPLLMAAWIPSVVTLFAGVWLMIHQEHG
jgi:lipopolysaccharide export system permease protein